MKVIKTAIDGMVIIEQHIFEDSKGCFLVFSQKEYDENVGIITFLQDNESSSSPFTQSKQV